jgi:hypothetical protein
MAGGELGTITTNLPARLDRLPWARFHKAEGQALESIARPLTAHETDDSPAMA